MKNFSVQELEAIGKGVSTMIGEHFEKRILPQFTTNELIKKAIEDTMRTVMKESSGHGTMFYQPTPPADVIVLLKSIEETAGNNDKLIELQKFNDDLYTVMTCLKKSSPHFLSNYAYWNKRWGTLAKALNTQTAGSGLEWVPTGYSSTMIDMVEIEAKVASKFFNFTMPTSTYIYPVKTSHANVYLGAEPTSDSPAMYKTSTMGTDDLSFTAVKLIVNLPTTEEMVEDSIVPILPALNKEIAIAMARGEDNAIINGDTTATHFDTAETVGSDDIRRAWKGLRRLCSDANSTMSLKIDGSAWTSGSNGLAVATSMIEDMGDYALTKSDLMYLLNTNMREKFSNITEVLTVDKFGGMATIKNGELSELKGIELVLSGFVEEHQNDSGIYDGATVTDTQFLVVHKPSFWIGNRRQFILKYVEKPMYGMNYLIATERKIWKPIRNHLTEGIVSWVYNITK